MHVPGPERGTTRGQIVRHAVAGEHTDTDQQGYIDGAVRTGERAARELIV